jgi:PAS domain S-box-containing protein
VLASARRIPAAGWFIVASLPTAEAFAPIRDMQQRMLQAAAFLTLLAGALTWWMLRRELAPMLAASKLLATLSATNQPPQSLPITRQDEIGDLIGGFNQLLKALGQREDALKESEFRWKFAIEGSGDGVWDWNIQTEEVRYSMRWKEMLGYSETDILPTNDEWVTRIHPDDQSYVAATMQAYLEGKTEIYVVEYRLRCKDESYKWILGRGMVVSRSEDGKPLRMISTHTDITERKQSEELVRESEGRLQAVYNVADIGVSITDQAGKYVLFNSWWTKQLGYDQEELEHLTNIDITFPEDAAESRMKFQEIVFGKVERYRLEKRFVRKDNSVFWGDLSVSAIKDYDGAVANVVGMVTDITVRKEAEAELVRHRHHLEKLVEERTTELSHARDAAEAANRAKSIFLATMSHEMRTPMNGVMGMIDLALRRATDPKQIDWLNKSKGSAKHLLDVIGDILDISHLEAEKMTLEEKNFSLTQVVEDALQMQGEAAQAKGLHLSPEISPTLPDLLFGDPTRLRQILINFVGNAIKFSDHGQITVSARVVEEDKLGVLLRIEVTDQGIGISPEQQARLFHAFAQADGTMNRKYGGTGLGLSIAKRIALLMGGDAGVISEEGQGSTFWVTVRLKKGSDVVEPPSTVNVDAEAEIRRRYAGRRILVVDDEPINLEVALIQLEFVDLVADTAKDGAEAVALARKNSYAAIFMDMQMPKLNGVEATQEIRQLPGYRDIPIIAMTANAFAGDKERCLKAGMSNFLTKPFNPDQLFAILLRAWVSGKGSDDQV